MAIALEHAKRFGYNYQEVHDISHPLIIGILKFIH